MSALDSLKWPDVRDHYDSRVHTHRRLLRLHGNGASGEFAKLLLGISDVCGNYSAAEHHLGPQILAENSNAPEKLHRIAEEFMSLKTARNVPEIIRDARLRYFQIGVGS